MSDIPAQFGAIVPAVRITAGVNDVIIFDEGGGDLTATLATDPADGFTDYFLYADDTTADSLLKAIKDALDAAGAFTYFAIFTIAPTDPAAPVNVSLAHTTPTTVVTLQFTDALTTFDGQLIGFASDLDEVTAGGVVNATEGATAVWYPTEFVSIDEEDRRTRPVATHEGPNGQESTFIQGVTRGRRRLMWEWVEAEQVFGVNVDTAADNNNDTMEALWTNFIGRGVRWLYIRGDPLTLAASQVVDTYTLEDPGVLPIPFPRPRRGIDRYAVDLVGREHFA